MTRTFLTVGMVVLFWGCSGPDETLELCTGQYSFGEIDDWFHQLSPQVMSIPGVHTIDADERYNCVMVGIEDSDVKSSVRSKSADVGVPADAIGFQITEPYEILDS